MSVARKISLLNISIALSLAAIGFASTQLLGGVVISTLHHLHWSYAHLFLLGGTVLLFAVCLLIPLRPSFTSTFGETKS